MNEAELSEAPARRIPTGSAGLDTLLHGGWMHGGTYMVTGAPGTGKTIFGNQFCFSHVAAGGRAVYVTMLSESHGRMMTHLGRLAFFRKELIGQSLHYVSGYATLKAEGLDGLARLLYRSAREHQASVLVVDGLLAVQEMAGSELVYREFLNSLGVHNALAGCTTLLLTNQQENVADPQFAMVDGVVRLYQDVVGMKVVRSVQVMKQRGGPHLLGRHTFDITHEGLVVYPRTEALYREQPERVPDPGQRKGFGLARLDEMLQGGLPAYTCTEVLGTPGSGKTLLGLNFLAAGARQGETGLYLSFMETPEQLVRKATGTGLELRHWVEAGRLVLESRTSAESLPDELVHSLLRQVERHQVQRLVLDGLEPFGEQLFAPERLAGFLTALTRELRARGVTSVMTQQTRSVLGPRLESKLEGVEVIVDNILLLRYVELRSQLYRMLSILKMRESDYEPALREFSISTQGLDVAETFESAEAILTGLARPLEPRRKTSRRKKPLRQPPSRRRGRS